MDNEGSVWMYRKGWSITCDLCNIILVTLYQVSAALACELFMNSITRGSTKEAEAAEALSKGDMHRFRLNMPEANQDPEQIPLSLLQWIENPVPDRFLGEKIWPRD